MCDCMCGCRFRGKNQKGIADGRSGRLVTHIYSGLLLHGFERPRAESWVEGVILELTRGLRSSKRDRGETGAAGSEVFDPVLFSSQAPSGLDVGRRTPISKALRTSDSVESPFLLVPKESQPVRHSSFCRCDDHDRRWLQVVATDRC